MSTAKELLHNGYNQTFAIDTVLYEQKNELQHLLIFENSCFGRVMMLDDIVQTTQKDEFIYHEMLTHVPLFAHVEPKNVLIVGGGDGGILREVLRHDTIESVTLVEIDSRVIELAKEFFPNHSAGAFDDARAHIVIRDASEFVREAADNGSKFDVIISDSTDPIGPGEVLFTQQFYTQCARLLPKDGIFVAQNGVSFLQMQEAQDSYQRLQKPFSDVYFYGVSVPTYAGGTMLLVWASQNADYRRLSLPAIQERYKIANIDTNYYNPEMHLASFALPNYIRHHLQMDS